MTVLWGVMTCDRVLGPDDCYIAIASDGVFEFLTNQMVADIITSKDDPLDACRAVVAQSYSLWLQYEVRTDDITVIIIKLDGIAGEEGPKKRASTLYTDVRADSKPVRRVMSREKKKTIVQDAVTYEAEDDDDEDEVKSALLAAAEKTAEEKQLISSAIRSSFIFQHLTDSQRDSVIGMMTKRVVKEGEWVITQGHHGDRLYIIESGKYEVRVRSSEEDKTGGNVVHVYESSATFHPSFGELSLM